MTRNTWQWLNPARLFHRATHLKRADWRDLGLKGLALLLAYALFLIARQPLSEVRVMGVQVEFTGLKQGVELLDDDQPHTVSVRLRGPRDVVRSVTPNQLTVFANLGNKEPGRRVAQLKLSDVVTPNRVEVLEIEPASLNLLLEKTGKKEVKVEPQYIGVTEEGYELYRAQVTPATLEIAGPQSLLDKLDQVKTESINLNGQRQSLTVTAEIELPNPALRVNNGAGVKVWLEIGARRVARQFSQVPGFLSGSTRQAQPTFKMGEAALQ